MSKPKKISYQLIPPDAMPDMYALVNDLISKVHDHLTNARIVLAWNLSWGADVDGKVILGKAKKCSDLDRELAEFDFVIMINRDFWDEANVAQRRALMDHELSHCAVTMDGDDPKVDEKGRTVWRMRKHDIEEFSGVVLRNGIYKQDLEVFYAALKNGKQGRIFGDPVASAAQAFRDSIPAGTMVTMEHNGKTTVIADKRCEARH